MIIDFNNQEVARRIILDSLPVKSVGAEIGVHLGDFSKKILKNVAPAKLHLIDPWRASESSVHDKTPLFGAKHVTQDELDRRFRKVSNDFKEAIDAGQVVIHRQLSDAAAGSFSKDYFDFVYIDGDHSYAAVLADLENYAEKVKVKGFLMMDDYARGNWWGMDVISACHDFLAKNKNYYIEFKASTQVVLRRFK